ncbi:regulatory protein RecX, partial [Marinobacter sp. 1Y8]
TAEPSDTPIYQPPEAQTIKEMLAEVKLDIYNDEIDNSLATGNGRSTEPLSRNSEHEAELFSINDSETDSQNDNIPAALKAYLRTPEQKQAEIDAIKAESRLRWLAFYYLSRREYGKAELKQKLIDKEQDPEKIDALLDEFEEKGYQSDYRTTLMLIRENIRKGRGRGRIKQEFYRKKIAMPGNIDELIDMANTESDEFSEFVDDDADNLVDGVDWLKLAVIARTKKYGNEIPVEQKEKAKQLRFLQYRGFNTDICFAALNHTTETLDERF